MRNTEKTKRYERVLKFSDESMREYEIARKQFSVWKFVHTVEAAAWETSCLPGLGLQKNPHTLEDMLSLGGPTLQ